MKRCSAPLVIREMQTKTMLRYHLTPLGLLLNKAGENEDVNCSWTLASGWEHKMAQLPQQTVWQFLKKHKQKCRLTPHATSGRAPEGPEIGVSVRYWYSRAHSSIIQKNCKVQVCQGFNHQWMDTVHTLTTEHHSALWWRKRFLMNPETQMNPEHYAE